ncbi:MAG: hypothetical protein D6732_28225 [Methanobacteriota archaeon]|nr:MAG: hypothetical protein D6732_28225 [Euryarchaeota archaeon]
MNVDHIFRAYDIRGIVGEDLTEEVINRIGKAFAVFIRKRGHDVVAVGGDIRGTTSELQRSLINGITEMGVNVHLVETGPLGLALFESFDRKLGASAFVTASHLPPEWNGVKFYWGEGIGFSPEENEEIHDLFRQNEFAPAEKQGTVEKVSTYQRYVEYLKDKFAFEKDHVIGVDCGNGATSVIMPQLFEDLGFKVYSIFDEPDPTFPNRTSEPNAESLKKFGEFLKTKTVEFGAGFDGDGDRCVFTDENGQVIPSDNAGLIIAEYLVKTSGNPRVIINEECSKIVEDELKKMGAEVKRIRVGHSFLSLEAKATNSIWGIEASGHAVAPEIFLFDDALILPLLMAKALEYHGKPLSELNSKIPSSVRQRFDLKCNDSVKFELVEKLTKIYKERYAQVSTLDGVSVTLPEGRVLVRVSNTSPKIRVTVEALNQEDFENLQKRFLPEIQDMINGS